MRSRSTSRHVTDSSSESIDEIVFLERERCNLLYQSGLLDDDEIISRGDLLRREIDQLKSTHVNAFSTSLNVVSGSTDGIGTFPNNISRPIPPYRTQQISPKKVSSDSDDSEFHKKVKKRFFFGEELKEFDENENVKEINSFSVDAHRGYHSCNHTPKGILERNNRNRRHSMSTTFADENFSKSYDNSVCSTFPDVNFHPRNDNGFMKSLDGVIDPRNRDLITKRQKHSSMAVSKSGNTNDMNRNGSRIFRPISMSLSKRAGAASKRFDLGTLQLLETLNLINTSTGTDNSENIPKSLFSPGYTILDRNGGTNFDDNVSDLERCNDSNNVNEEDNNNCIGSFHGGDYDENDTDSSNGNGNEIENDNHRSSIDREKRKEKEKEIERGRMREKEISIMNIDHIYQESPQLLDVIQEDSPYYYSAHNTPEKIDWKVGDVKGRKSSTLAPAGKISPTAPIRPSPNSRVNGLITGLLEGGILEFCTVDMNILSLLSRSNINNTDSCSIDSNSTCKSAKGNTHDGLRLISNQPSNNSNNNNDTNNITAGSDGNGSDGNVSSIDDDSKENIVDISAFITPKKSCCIPVGNFSIEHIHDFCFPSGVPVDFVSPKQAKILTDSSDYDTFHTLQFTNGKGQPTYACCIIINILYKPKTKILKKKLMQISTMQDAANKIKKAFKTFSVTKKRNLWLSLGMRNGGLDDFGNSMSGRMCSNRTYGSTETYGSVSSNASKSRSYSNTSYNNVNNSNNDNNNSSRSRGKSISSTGSMPVKSNTNTNTNTKANTVRSKKDRSLPSSSSPSKEPHINSKGTEYENANANAVPNKYFTAKNLKGMASKFLYGPKGGKSMCTNNVSAPSYSDAPSLYNSVTAKSSTSSRVHTRGLSVKTNISMNSTNNSISTRSDTLNNSSSTISDDTTLSPKGTKTTRQREAITSPKNVRKTSTDSNITIKSPKSGSTARSRSGSNSSPVPSASPTSKDLTRETSKKTNNYSSSGGKNLQNTIEKLGSEKSVLSTASTSTSASSSASVASAKGVGYSKSNVSGSSGTGAGTRTGTKSSGQKGGTGSGILDNDSSKSSNKSNNNSSKNNEKGGNSNSNSNNAANNTSIGVIVNAVHKNKQDVNMELKAKQKQNQRNLIRLRKERSLRIREDSFCLVTQKAYCLISVEADHAALFQVLKIMVGSERRNTDFNYHGFEEQEEKIGKSGKSVSMQEILDNLSSDVENANREANDEISGREEINQDRDEGQGLLYGRGTLTRSTSEKSHRTEIQRDLVILENYCCHASDGEKDKSEASVNVNAMTSEDGKATEMKRNARCYESGRGSNKADKNWELVRANCRKLRYAFLLKIEEHFKAQIDRKKSKSYKLPEIKTKTVTTVTTDSSGAIGTTRVTTTVTETTTTEIIQSTSALSVPGYIEGVIDIDFSSLPPTKDWACALLFATVTSDTLFKIIHLLLTEKSLIVYGSDKGYVTAISLAVMELLKPFSWQGIFVPLISSSAIELFEAPVPFILGTTFLPDFQYMSPSAAVLNVQAPKDFDDDVNENGDSKFRRENSTDSVERFDTWKDCGSNPKGEEKIQKSSDTENSCTLLGRQSQPLPPPPLQSLKAESSKSKFGSLSSSQRSNGYDAGPRAWFLSLPEMEEEMPEASYLAGWIDRSRRFLSTSVILLEKNEKEKRKNIWQEKENMEIENEQNLERERKEKEMMAEEQKDDIKRVSSTQQDEDDKRDRRFSVSTTDSHSLSSSGVPILSTFTAKTPSPDPIVTPGKTFISSDDNMEEYEESPPRPHCDGSANFSSANASTGASATGREFQVSDMMLQRLARNQIRANQELTSSTLESGQVLVQGDGNANENEIGKGTDIVKKDRKALKKRNVSFSFDSLNAALIDGEGVTMPSAPVMAAIMALNRADPTPDVTADSNNCSSAYSPSHLPSGVSSLNNSPKGLSISPNPSPSTTSSSSSFFSFVTGENSTSTSQLVGTLHTTSAPFAPSILLASLPATTNIDRTAPTSHSLIASKGLPPPSPFSTETVVMPPYVGPTPSPVWDVTFKKGNKSEVDNNALRVTGNEDLSSVVGDEAEKKKGIELSAVASDYSPFREPGNGKSWLEQVLRMTDKPLRKTHQKAAHRGATAANSASASESQKSTTDSLNSEYATASHIMPTAAATCSPRPAAPPLLPFVNGMTHTETMTVRKLLLEIRKYSSTFCSGFSEPDAWKKFVKYNRATNDDEFFPDLFLQRQRTHLDFQESLVKTQLFVTYMAELRADYNERENVRRFLSIWLYFRIYLRNKSRRFIS